MDAAARPHGAVAETAVLAVLGALLVASVFAGGGSRAGALASVGLVAVAAAAVGLAAALRGAIPLARLDRPGSVAALAACGLVAWTGLSTVWSIAGDRSWEWFGRGLVYVAFLALGLLAGALVAGVRRAAAMLAVVLGAALGWALAGVAIPALFEDGDRIARLREPVGYWNALALLADGALALALWLARDARVAVRLLGTALGYAAILALLLTQSRAGVVAALVVVGAWLVLSDRRLEDALRGVLFAVPALVVGGWAFTRPALVEVDALRADRVSDGRVFAVLALAGLGLAALASWKAPVRRLVAERGPAVRTALVVVAVVAALAGAAGVAAAVGNPFAWVASQVRGGECENDPGRLTDLCANNRLAWWDEALEIAADRPLGGSGAGTYAIARRRVRDDATSGSQPHSVPLQLLADTGVVGLALGLLVVAAGAVGVRRGIRLADGPERAPAVAVTCLVLAFCVHAVVDYDLDFLAVSGPVLAALGVLLATGRPRSTRRFGIPVVVAVAAVGAAAGVVLLLPALADRAVERSLAASDAGRVEAAVDAAERARRLDPFSRAPLEALAYAADVAGDQAAAVAWYEEATRLQPENPDAWFALGLYHAIATGDQCAAYTALNHSYTLDPNGSRWGAGGPLDVARDAVNAGACED
jgi:tetratricopeptide (TPR) repeat protein